MNPTSELYDSLEEAYIFFNRHLFGGGLPTVIFTVQRKKGVMGYFAPDRWGNIHGNKCHEIAINPSYIANSCLIEVLQTLAHEMVHCWQYCFGLPSRGHYHNREWAKKMIEIGLMPSVTGLPGGAITGQMMSDYIIEDGPFFRVYEQLKEQNGFQLKWIDRIAADKVFDPAFYSAPELTAPEAQVETTTTLDSVTAVSPVESGYVNSLPQQPFKEQTFAEIAPADLFIPVPARSKNSKKKYSCHTCNLNVWGKPGLNIICGGCNSTFVEDS
ncbi:SprT-like domain-containing protein [Teredinibacter turnerae]|uniref:SprT-like domain-containing protein n=1 Tax=Teredinibacter turnerae TaxID=2426 RepID=UPI000416C54F|nr:SprT-like domain-containing protein [Teredinibacter turnerae]